MIDFRRQKFRLGSQSGYPITISRAGTPSGATAIQYNKHYQIQLMHHYSAKLAGRLAPVSDLRVSQTPGPGSVNTDPIDPANKQAKSLIIEPEGIRAC